MGSLYQDCRLIAFNSNDAFQKLNGDKNSNLLFSVPNLITDDSDIQYSTVGIIDAQIPVSWTLIDSDTNILNLSYLSTLYQIQLPLGNYNGENIVSTLEASFDLVFSSIGVTSTVILDLITGRLTFKFVGATGKITFLYNGSDGIFRILGLLPGLDYESVTTGAFEFIFPSAPLNLLGIKQIRVCSNNLATINNFTSGQKNPNNIICSIPINEPAWSLITYENKTNLFSKLKSRNISIIDIQLFDELGRYIQMNSINYTFTLQIVIYRQLGLPTQVLSLGSQQNSLGSDVSQDVSQDVPPPDVSPPDGTRSLRDELDILQYQ